MLLRDLNSRLQYPIRVHGHGSLILLVRLAIMHPVLLGDSIFANATYVGEDRDVVSNLRGHLGDGDEATLLAVDGSETADIAEQLKGLPESASHLFISVGGNDALRQAGFLDENARHVAVVLRRMRELAEQFIEVYEAMLTTALAHNLPICVCTIYFPRFPHPGTQKAALSALSGFNDCIMLCAIRHNLPVLDLRQVCDDITDYANPIEPSAGGGAKIAAALHRTLHARDWSRTRTEVFY